MLMAGSGPRAGLENMDISLSQKYPRHLSRHFALCSILGCSGGVHLGTRTEARK